MGGVGKTVLAKNINNRLLEKSEGGVFWVTVSQEFSVKNLQDKIARYLNMELLDEDDEDIRAARLHGVLSKQKNSVLILDDVWECIDMAKLGYTLSGECCRLIITTRLLKVCHQMCCQEIVAVQKLKEDEAWKLFNETLTWRKGAKLGPQVEEIAKSVAKFCDGLPLGIITLGGSMRGETNIHTWRNALEELKEFARGEEGMGEDVFEVLKYSFKRLKTNHQRQGNGFNLFQLCFLYCSLYPEDREIHRHQLIRRFISEGLVDTRDSRRAQVDLGHYILDKLVNVSLLESCVDYFGYECVKMHDLVRGMALRIGRGKYMARAGEKSLKEIPKVWRKHVEVSLMNNGITRIPNGISPICPKLSTLLLQGNPLEEIPNRFFSNMYSLSTLDLCNTHIAILPSSISALKSLKALLLEGCGMLEYMPYLGNLKALKELNLSGTSIKKVPQGVEELLNLKFLSIDAPLLEMLPRGLLLKLGQLQYVKFPFHVQVVMEEVENLRELEEFWGTVKDVCDFNRFIRSRRSRVHDALYNIQVGCTYVEDFGYHYKQLVMFKYNLKDRKVLGHDIEGLTMSNCEGVNNYFLDSFPPSSNPRSLKRLRIEKCGRIEYIWSSEEGLPSLVSNLEYILLVELEDLKGVMEKRDIGASAQGVFSSLRFLHIENCGKMRKLGLPVSGFPKLEVVTIESCGEIEMIFEDEERGCVTLPELKELNLRCLSRLKSVCKATLICKSIKEMGIEKCPRLMKKLPLLLAWDTHTPPTLKSIRVERQWWESLDGIIPITTTSSSLSSNYSEV